jgi:hypothetical protein
MGFTRHLAENAVGDIVVAAPIGGAFGIGELIHVMAAQLLGQTRGLAVNRARAVDLVALPAQRLDGGDFSGAVLRGTTAIKGRPSIRAK